MLVANLKTGFSTSLNTSYTFYATLLRNVTEGKLRRNSYRKLLGRFMFVKWPNRNCFHYTWNKIQRVNTISSFVHCLKTPPRHFLNLNIFNFVKKLLLKIDVILVPLTAWKRHFWHYLFNLINDLLLGNLTEEHCCDFRVFHIL